MNEISSSKMYNTFNIDISTSVHDTEHEPNVISNFHQNFEIIIVTEGYCNCDINSHKHRATKGEAILICPLQFHSFSVGECSSVRRLTFHRHLILTIYQALEGHIPKDPVFRPDSQILSLIIDFFDKSFGMDSGHISRIQPFEKRMQTKGFLYILGSEFLRSVELIPTPKSDSLTMDIAQYVAENFRKNISLKDIAKDKGYNYQYISRVFNSVMDINFKKMLNHFRLEYAFGLLQDTDLSISSICFESGFGSLRTFNQVCLEAFGKPPKLLRRETKIVTTKKS